MRTRILGWAALGALVVGATLPATINAAPIATVGQEAVAEQSVVKPMPLRKPAPKPALLVKPVAH